MERNHTSKETTSQATVHSEPRQGGFSLIEIVVVMVIVAIMAVFAAPSLVNFRPNMRLKGAARDLHTNLQLMKVGAIKNNRTMFITFSPVACAAYPSTAVPSPGGTYTIDSDLDNNGTLDAAEKSVVGSFTMLDTSGDADPDYDYDLPENTALCINPSLPAGNTTFQFTSRGFWLDGAGAPPGADTTIQMQNDKGSGYTITISIAGGIATEKLP